MLAESKGKFAKGFPEKLCCSTLQNNWIRWDKIFFVFKKRGQSFNQNPWDSKAIWFWSFWQNEIFIITMRILIPDFVRKLECRVKMYIKNGMQFLLNIETPYLIETSTKATQQILKWRNFIRLKIDTYTWNLKPEAHFKNRWNDGNKRHLTEHLTIY